MVLFSYDCYEAYYITKQGMEWKQEQKISDYKQKQDNPADETVIYKIGSTFYEVANNNGDNAIIAHLLTEKLQRLGCGIATAAASSVMIIIV